MSRGNPLHMLILAPRWRGSRPLLCLIIYELLSLNIRAETKPQSIVSASYNNNSLNNMPSQVSVSIPKTNEYLVSSEMTLLNLYEQDGEKPVMTENKDNKMLNFLNKVLSPEEFETIPLNFSLFSFPTNGSDPQGRQFRIPRYMMEYFAQNDIHSRKLPEGASIARSFLVDNIEIVNSEEEEDGTKEEIMETKINATSLPSTLDKSQSIESLKEEEESQVLVKTRNIEVSNLENKSSIIKTKIVDQNHDNVSENISANITSPYTSRPKLIQWKPNSVVQSSEEVIRKKVYSFSFNIKFSKDEILHSALLRVFVRANREDIDITGVERRIKVYVSSFDNKSNQTTETRNMTNVPIVQSDIYIFKSEWREIDITSAIQMFKQNPKGLPQRLRVEISADFYGVGGRGEFDIETDLESSLRPFILLFSTHKLSQVKKSLTQNHRKRRSLSTAEWEEEETNSIWEGISNPILGLPHQMLEDRRLGKKARRRRAKNSCKRKPLKIVFKDIGWDHWIIAPQSYEAHQCSGKCFYPLASHLSPTKHAVVQNLVHSLQPDIAARACCVPTKLGPISLLYLKAGLPTYNYDYTEMVVLECGCR